MSDMLYGQNDADSHLSQVYAACQQPIEAKQLERRGKGGQDDPYTFHPPTPEPIKRRW